ncbi:C45 family peptidase [Cohaesibacter marisflavi]|uniref:C45 family peptidase n=1 Tax=Cohaesibacter marisflavi TaxID=655353 RepID=UPI0029C6EFF0|nr:C45 family peptidase [Cohaesibacter marisflavi]
MSNKPRDLGRIEAAGTPFQIGYRLGKEGCKSVHEHLLPSEIWQQVTEKAEAGKIQQMSRMVQEQFPRIWEELKGLAEGLELPLDQVVAWNCRGDLLASAPDGCTTVALPGDNPVVAHNEDGLPFFRGACFLADIRPDAGPAFTSFCYPGSIPGHTFAITETGMVQTVNNLRLEEAPFGMPRMVIGRAMLACSSLEGVLKMLHSIPTSGGFHVLLGQRSQEANMRLVSIEFGAGTLATKEISTPFAHANHALLIAKRQIVTESSRDRQKRAQDLLTEKDALPLAILRDIDGQGLPIRRDQPDDPDNENTLATGLFEFCKDKVKWTIYDTLSDDSFYTNR